MKTILILLGTTCLIPMAIAPPAIAQDATINPSKASTVPTVQQPANKDDNAKSEIVVTGTANRVKKVESTISTSTITEQDLKILAVNGTAQLLANIPGFLTEGGTAGETHNNVQVRGLPQAGGFRYVPNLIDSLPAFEEPEAPFMNNDVFIKTDIMTTRVEAIKGGPGGILYSNALGAAVNYITRTGGQDYKLGYNLELGSNNRVRNDLFISGPISKNLTFAIGGFYRTSNGVRDPGFTANKGGQIRGNLKFTSDDETLSVVLSGQHIDDVTAFYQNLPYAVAKGAIPGTTAAPFFVDPGKVQNLGLDFGTGTSASNQTSFYQLYDGSGRQFNLNIKDGIHPKFDIFTAKIDKGLGDGWSIGANVRSTRGSNGFNALFQDPPVDTNFLINGNPANAGDNGLTGLIHSAPYAAYYINAVAVKGYYTNSVTGTNLSKAQAAPSVLANDVPVYGHVNATNFVADLRLGKRLNLNSMSHDITLGIYNSHYTYDVTSVFARAYSSIEPNSRKIDFYAVDATGQQVGPSITKDSVINPALFGLGATSSELTRALYALDHVSLFNDKLNIDVGVRYQDLKINRVTTNSFNPGNTCANVTPNNVIVGSTNDSLAYKCVSIPNGAPQYDSQKYHGFGYSLGANYRLFGGPGSSSGETTIYATYAKSFRLPGFEDYIFGGPATNASTGQIAQGDLVEEIRQYEVGIRHVDDQFNLSLSGFIIDFKAKQQLGPTLVDLSTSIGGVACSVVPTPNNCPVVRDTYRTKLNNKGLELELGYRPSYLSGLNLQGSIVLQDPKLSNDAVYRNGIINGQYNLVQPATYVPQRQPKIVMNFRPLYAIPGTPLTLFGQVYYYGKRFSGNDDTAIYPAYTQINAGALFTANKHFDLQFNVDNVNNATSFTEGGSINSGTVLSDGRYVSVARPLIGRSWKFTLSYRY